MTPQTKQMVIGNYRGLFQKYGDAPEATQWSPEGQLFRLRKLLEIGDLRKRRVLDLGCGLGALYPLLLASNARASSRSSNQSAMSWSAEEAKS